MGMSRSFLVGRFLPAYGRTFGKLSRPVRTDGALTQERLAVRFDERARRHRERSGEYRQRIQAGLVASLLVVVGVFRGGPMAGEGVSFDLDEQEVVVMEEIVQTRQIERPPPPPRPPVPVEVPNDVLLDDITLDLDASLDIDLAVADLPPPPPEPVIEEAPEPEIFVVVEEMPTMIGGLAALVADLDYPELARKAGLEGTVVVEVVIPPSGVPQDPQIRRSVGSVLDAEAVRAVMEQRFTPGMQRGRAVTVAMNIPVKFALN